MAAKAAKSRRTSPRTIIAIDVAALHALIRAGAPIPKIVLRTKGSTRTK